MANSNIYSRSVAEVCFTLNYYKPIALLSNRYKIIKLFLAPMPLGYSYIEFYMVVHTMVKIILKICGYGAASD